MKRVTPVLMGIFLAALAFTLATAVEAEFKHSSSAENDKGALSKILGEGRRLFSGQAVEMADVYMHSGYYPSIFDQREQRGSKAIETEEEDHSHHKHDENGKCVRDKQDHTAHKHDEHGNCRHEEGEDAGESEHERAMSFMGRPRDPLDAFIRNFRITEHSHLEKGEEREMLPWLRLAIELDPQAIDTYTVASYWLRRSLKRVEDARDILREGILNNPRSYELLFSMGQIYQQEDKNVSKARNIWLAALRYWKEQSAEEKESSRIMFSRILSNLAHLESDAGNLELAVKYFEMAKTVSPIADGIQKQIDEIKARMTGATNSQSVIP